MVLTSFLDGRALLWASWDPAGMVTAALRGLLVDRLQSLPIRPRLLRAANAEQMAQLVAAQSLGLAVWCVSDDPDELAVCRSLQLASQKLVPPVRVCYLSQPRNDSLTLLLEAGAQIVVSDIPSLQQALPRALSAAPLSASDYHPLTAGIVERLPWATVESN